MRNLPESVLRILRENYEIRPSCTAAGQAIRAEDESWKWLWQLADGDYVESVLISAHPGRTGEVARRKTLCVSTQVGCAYGCVFCASGLDGFKRNLTADEIVGQVLAAETQLLAPDSENRSERRIQNLVFMGMGEPLANYDNLLPALTILNADWGGGIGARRITISTCGLVPGIRRLVQEPHQFRLAISLHGPTDEIRERIMPVNRRYPLKDLIEACDEYVSGAGRLITLEYILIANVNDDPALIRPLGQIALRLRAKVNLIPYNRVKGLDWRRPPENRQERFVRELEALGVSATLRREKGHDIDAACGQLRRFVKRSAHPVSTNAAP